MTFEEGNPEVLRRMVAQNRKLLGLAPQAQEVQQSEISVIGDEEDDPVGDAYAKGYADGYKAKAIERESSKSAQAEAQQIAEYRPVDDFDVEVAIAEAISIMPKKTEYTEKGVPVLQYLRKLGYIVMCDAAKNQNICPRHGRFIGTNCTYCDYPPLPKAMQTEAQEVSEGGMNLIEGLKQEAKRGYAVFEEGQGNQPDKLINDSTSVTLEKHKPKRFYTAPPATNG